MCKAVYFKWPLYGEKGRPMRRNISLPKSGAALKKQNIVR